MSTEENRAIVRGIIETWNKGTLDVLDDLCVADVSDEQGGKWCIGDDDKQICGIVSPARN